jgi:hypothetical protein
MFGESALYTVNTGLVTISTANSGLDGSGTLGTVLTAASNGTYIKTVTIKAQTRALQGMIRLFIYDGTNTRLLTEIQVDPHAAGSATWKSYAWTFFPNFFLKAGDVLKASTQLGDTYNVIAEGFDISY